MADGGLKDASALPYPSSFSQQNIQVLLTSSDEKHRVARIAGESFHVDLVQGQAERGGDLFPGVADGRAGFAVAGHRALEERGVHRIDDLAQGDGLGRAGEEVTAGHAAAAVDETGPADIVEDLHQKVG